MTQHGKQRMEVRLYMDQVEVWYGQKKVEQVPRLRGRRKHRVEYGVPQHLRRVIFFLSREGETIEPVVPSHGGDGHPFFVYLRGSAIRPVVARRIPVTPVSTATRISLTKNARA
jgi:hypothetical protein